MTIFYHYTLLTLLTLAISAAVFFFLRKRFRKRQHSAEAHYEYAEMAALDMMLQEANIKYAKIVHQFRNGKLVVETPRQMKLWKSYPMVIAVVNHEEETTGALKPDARIKLADYVQVDLDDKFLEGDNFMIEIKDNTKLPLMNIQPFEKKIVWRGSIRPVFKGSQSLYIPIKLFTAEKEEAIDFVLKELVVEVQKGFWSFTRKIKTDLDDKVTRKSLLISGIIFPIILFFLEKLYNWIFS